uniref:Retrotransposon gag domain-containing protein n=1 Tax=Nicotiana tabacum TaxID=4097 RepID=A0A1S3XR58_TOBAC|nr:PREDICTED: uncharacterized protein LOC107767846 [Nicotiana tabacum]
MTRNDEHVAKMAQEMESLREEVSQIRELAYLAMTTLPHPLRFPSLDSLPHHSPSISRQNNNIPTSIPTTQVIPLVTPASPPNPLIHTLYIPQYTQISQKLPITTNVTTPLHDRVTFTTNQHISVAHAATHERYVPLVYAISEPTFTAPIIARVLDEIDQYAEMEREARRKEEDSVSEELQMMRRQMKNLKAARGSESLDYEDLCIHPDMDIPSAYKPPKFDIFGRTGDPHAHLRVYCDKLAIVGRNEKLRMKLFIRSLMGEALTWYTRQDPRNWRTWQDMAKDIMNHFRFNTEITSDRFALVNLQKKPSESFQPLLDDIELTKYFIRA